MTVVGLPRTIEVASGPSQANADNGATMNPLLGRIERCSCLMHRPIGRYRRSKHSKSLTSLNMTRRLLYVRFRFERRIVRAKETAGYG